MQGHGVREVIVLASWTPPGGFGGTIQGCEVCRQSNSSSESFTQPRGALVPPSVVLLARSWSSMADGPSVYPDRVGASLATP
jgi:hypothetical protein